MKEHALSVMLLAKAAKCTPPPLDGSESVCINLLTSSDQLYFSFTDVLLQCSSVFPGSMAHVFLTVIERYVIRCTGVEKLTESKSLSVTANARNK